ncbi:XRE family transcriptional regulator [Stenotrophomonas maltophilia]|uniref:XRE family transcriptional regulator n=1 Tax=Stenotrophomonas maltophilia TaxID=40324 RepID=UPI0015DFCAB4|nr:XRE family transcriptional regulator [Stenotrophomonas maltophilia]MBA0294375.1 helix-turn-helix transcriptional regulator [Stenotrophomonas maltophilia]
MNTIGGRVRLEREARGIGRAELAKMTGIGYSTLSELERGGMQTSTKLHVIADALGVSVRWLETGKGPKAAGAAAGSDDSDWADISGYAQAIGLGGGPEAQEYAETHKLKFRAESLARKRLRPNALAVMYGKGDSMEPRIHSGDAILFDTSDTNPRDGQMYVIMVDGGGAAKEYHVKRCEVIDDLVFFKADNPRGDHNWRKPKRLDNPRHPIQVVGRVRWIGSWEG